MLNSFYLTRFKLKDSVTDGGIAFDKFYGTHIFEYMALDARFRLVFNNAMVNHSTFVNHILLICNDARKKQTKNITYSSIY